MHEINTSEFSPPVHSHLVRAKGRIKHWLLMAKQISSSTSVNTDWRIRSLNNSKKVNMEDPLIVAMFNELNYKLPHIRDAAWLAVSKQTGMEHKEI